jgi:hypothetical protein
MLLMRELRCCSAALNPGIHTIVESAVYAAAENRSSDSKANLCYDHSLKKRMDSVATKILE